MEKTCPCCGGTLETGLVRSSHLIYWTRERGLYTVDRKAGEFPLQGASRWMGSDCPACYCPACELILIAAKEDEKHDQN